MTELRLPRLQGDAVIARCQRCAGTVTAFNPVATGTSSFTQTEEWTNGPVMVTYVFLKCSACGMAAVATLVTDYLERGPYRLDDFHPRSPNFEVLPEDVPRDLFAEVREAEWAASVGAFRAATALLRSALEKTLKSNGYVEGVLARKIDEAEVTESSPLHADVKCMTMFDTWAMTWFTTNGVQCPSTSIELHTRT